MQLSRQFVLTVLSLALVVLLAVAPATASEVRGDTLAAMSGLGDHVAWVPNSGAESLALRVSGPGTEFSERFDGGVSPIFGLFDAEGNARADGTYTWELREERPGVNDEVRDPANGRDTAAHTGSSRVEFSGRLQWGSFTIENGAMVDANLVEERAVRPTKD